MSFSFVPGETVEVPEIPVADEMQLPASDSAVIVVDMQNDFVHPEGNLVAVRRGCR